MKNNIIKVYNSTLEMAKGLRMAEVQPPFKKISLHSAHGSEAFTGTCGYDEADNLLIRGDKKSLSTLKTCAPKATAKRKGGDFKPRIQNDIYGFVPNVANYLAGVPNDMVNVKMVRVPNTKVLNIGYIVCASCGVSAKDMAKAGAKLLSYIQAIEAKGLRVNLYVISGGYTSNQTAVMMVKVKDSGHYINPAKIAYPVINPSMHRRHGFRFLETAEGVDSSFVSGYGRPLETKHVEEVIKDLKVKFNLLFSMPEMDAKMQYLIK